MVDLDAIFSEMESRSTPDDSVLCVIDDNLRIVTVPSSGMVFGVEKDKDVNKIDFEMDRYYRDNDMSEFSARIYYQNAKGNKNYSTVTDLSFTEDKITFSWTVPAYALMYEGTIRFAVNFIKTSGSVVEKAFNTTIASANCLIGLYIDTQIPEKEFEDYLTHLKNEIKGYSDVQLAAIEDAKTEALIGIDDAEEEALLNIKQALPAITDSDFGKAVTVKSDVSGVELSGPYAPIEVAVRPTVSGNPAVAEDSIAWKLQGLKVYGKSTQDGTPSPETPVPIVSAGDGGSVQVSVKTGQLLDNTDGIKTSYKSQILTLPTLNGLPGIPVESGGNFTDADGQQWICNYIDLNDGKIYCPVKKYIASEQTINLNDTWTQINPNYAFVYVSMLDSLPIKGVISNVFKTIKYTVSVEKVKEPIIMVEVVRGHSVIYFSIPKSALDVISPESFKNYMESISAEFIAANDNPNEVVDISDEELAAYRALTTYDGTTVVSTAEPVAGIEVSYVADTQKYIDKKIEEAISKLNAAQQGEETNVSL